MSIDTGHFTRKYVWVVITSLGSLNEHGYIPYDALRKLGVTGIYLSRVDPLATNAKRLEVINSGFKCGYFAGWNTTNGVRGDEVARRFSSDLAAFAQNDQGQTPVLLDFEPSSGATQFWLDFLWGRPGTKAWRGINGIATEQAPRYFRVTDFYGEGYFLSGVPIADVLKARLDVKVSAYFGDMSQLAIDEAVFAWEDAGFPREGIHVFYDGGRYVKPPIFYQGRVAAKLRGGSCIWNADLLREAGLI